MRSRIRIVLGAAIDRLGRLILWLDIFVLVQCTLYSNSNILTCINLTNPQCELNVKNLNQVFVLACCIIK